MSDGVKHTTLAEELAAGRTVTYFTVGISMKPLLRTRKTHVTVAPLPSPDAAEPGDILLYLRPGDIYVLHRLMKRDTDAFYMRGDNTYELERIHPSQAIGVVTHIYRRGQLFDVHTRRSYRLYVAVWNAIYPLRHFVARVKWFLSRRLRRQKKEQT